MTPEEEFRANTLLQVCQDQRDWALAEWGKVAYNLRLANARIAQMDEELKGLRALLTPEQKIRIFPLNDGPSTRTGDLKIEGSNGPALELQDRKAG